MMFFSSLVSAFRQALWADFFNLSLKSRFSSNKEKYEKRLDFLRLVRRQSREPFVVASPQLFIDISSLVGRDNRTGIHRFVRSVATYVSRMGTYKGYRLSLVYASKYRLGYWHAFEYERQVLGKKGLPEKDQPIAYKSGDIFFELDWNMKLTPLQRPFFEQMAASGVQIFFNVFDIIPLQLHDLYSQKSQNRFESWLLDASRYAGVLCNSQAVAEEYRAWRQKKGLPNEFIIKWFHLGADIENSHPSQGLPAHAGSVLDAIREGTSILMVSALHPRKGYAQTLAAFELLWEKGKDVRLVIVGKDLHMDDTAQYLRGHPEQGHRLFWLDDISDEYLDLVYHASTAVLFASRAEGFGLAVWEGARYGKPLILRDLPVFRELAGDAATYFSGLDPESLARCIEIWMQDLASGQTVKPLSILHLTWEESVRHMLKCLTE